MKLTLLLAIVALGLGLAACGSSAGTSNNGSAATGASSNARYQARLNLAKCLRQHGLNVPDPSPGGGGAFGSGGPPGGFRALRDNPNFQSAFQACAKYRRGAFGFRTLSPSQQAQFQRALVKFAECMRAHNIDIPDPTTGSGGGFRIFRQISPSERQSPAFQNALKACVTNLPFRRGGPGGGPAGAPPAATPGA